MDDRRPQPTGGAAAAAAAVPAAGGERSWPSAGGRLEVAAWLAAYVAVLASAVAAGYRMWVPWPYVNLLPRELLVERLGESLWNLHSQPPLLNLVLGGALALEAAGGAAVETWLFVLQGLIGGVVVAATAVLLLRLRLRRWLRAVVMALLLLDPAFYYFVALFFTPIYELLFLGLAAVAVHRFACRPGAGAFAALCVPVVALVYGRALFHPVWAGAALAAVAIGGGRLAATAVRRRVAVVLALAALLLVAWPVKNALRFGVWGFSSWQGFNLSRGFAIAPPPAWALFTWERLPGAGAARAGALALIPARFRGIPALTMTAKADGSPNWNHYAMIAVSAELGRQAREIIVHQPGKVAVKALDNYLRKFCRSPVEVGEGTLRRALFAACFPLLCAVAAWRIFQLRAADRPAAITLAFLLTTVLWVLAMALFVDGDEAWRLRFSTQLALWIGGAAALDGWLPRRSAQGT
jgi:hypothetical protein